MIFVLGSLSAKLPSYFKYTSKFEVQSTKIFLTTDVTIRVNDCDNCAICRRVFAFERKTRFSSPAPENQFTNPSSGGIYCNHWLALGAQIFVEGLNDEKFAALKRVVLDRCYDRSNDSRELHIILVWSAESALQADF